jgi:hypothetical protein
MVTIYHNLDPGVSARMADPAFRERYGPEPSGLELAGVVAGTDDLDAAFDHTIHRDGENWTDYAGVIFFGDRRGRRSSQEGDVFVTGDGSAFLVLSLGFHPLPDLRLPFLP